MSGRCIVLEPSASEDGAQGRNTSACGIGIKCLLRIVCRDSLCDFPDKVLVFFNTIAGYVSKTKYCNNNNSKKTRMGWSSGKNV
jgi:hypothetical protein